MLHLNPGIHLNEVEGVILKKEFKCAGSPVAHIEASTNAGGTNLVAQGIVDPRCGCFLNHLLMATLKRTIAIAKMNGIALAVGQHLNFDVTGPLQEFLHVDHRGAKRRLRLGLGHLNR